MGLSSRFGSFFLVLFASDSTENDSKSREGLDINVSLVYTYPKEDFFSLFFSFDPFDYIHSNIMN